MRTDAGKIAFSPGHYDASSYTRERDWGWPQSGASEDATFTYGDRLLALARLRREVRNNPFLAGLAQKFAEAVGTSNLRSAAKDRKFNSDKESFWWWFQASCEVSGMNLSAVERIILLELLFAGEVFVVLLRDGRIQLVTSEFCGPGTGAKPEDGEVNGIVYNANGRPTGYRIATTDRWGMINFGESEIVDARYVIHIFDRDRVAMGRGLPWLLPSVTTFRDLYEIVRAKTKQVKDASQVFATLERAGLDKLVGIAGPTVTDFGPSGVAAETADSPADKTGAAAEKQRQIDLKNGTVVALDPGEKISLLQSKYEAQDFTQLIGFMLRAGAAPAGLPVELWFSGFGDANYSASKAINAIQWDGRRQAICRFMEDKFLNRLHRWRIAKARKEGDLPPLSEKDVEQEDMISWGWGRTPLLDKVEEAKAIEARMRLGLTTVSEEVSREGKFFEEELERRAEDYAKAAEIAKAKGVPIEALLPEAMIPPKKAATPAPAAN